MSKYRLIREIIDILKEIPADRREEAIKQTTLFLNAKKKARKENKP
ncbi:MAG: hypothetical protein K5847_05080 [Lachnospiraceae bacterium]|nr:hypothetical protein [Lachnospiraceae bacterium]